jgi:7-cyano-7-deazaguanine synthase
MKVMVVLSGGMDSATLLYDIRSKGHDVVALTVHYGQRHHREIAAARALTKRANVPHRIVQLPELADVLQGSSQTDLAVPVPHGRYDDESMRSTVVPNRNMILLAIAAGAAIAERCDAIAYGAHAGDHAIYPDCRPVFITAMREALKLCDYHELALLAPFEDWTKAMIARHGTMLGVPYELTWTCYEGLDAPCGKCGACVERAEAFGSLPRTDPLIHPPGSRRVSGLPSPPGAPPGDFVVECP